MEQSDTKSVALMSDLESAITFSIKCHRRAENKHGYWFDLIGSKPFGSEAWLLKREPFNSSIVPKYDLAIKEALWWLPPSTNMSVKTTPLTNGLRSTITVDNAEFTYDL